MKAIGSAGFNPGTRKTAKGFVTKKLVNNPIPEPEDELQRVEQNHSRDIEPLGADLAGEERQPNTRVRDNPGRGCRLDAR